MKNRFLAFASVAIFALAAVFSSCETHEATEALVLDTSKSATVKGKVWAELDETDEDGEYEAAPSGTKVIAVISNSDYDLNVSGSKTYETTIGSDGSYEFSLPADETGVYVTIMFEDFEYETKVEEYDYDIGDYVTTTERNIYSASDININLTAGNTYIRDQYYSY